MIIVDTKYKDTTARNRTNEILGESTALNIANEISAQKRIN